MKQKPLLAAEVDIQIPFHDVDLMAVAWHGHYVKYFEIARCALLERIQYNYQQMRDSGFAWPVVDLHIRYPGPARFNETLTVKAALVEWENRLRIQYEARNAEGRRVTYGHTDQVAVKLETGEMELVSPAILHQKLAAWLDGNGV